MAFPVVEGTAETAVSTAGTSHAITLPASIASTDGVLILTDIGSTAATFNALTDWSEIVDENVANGIKVLWFTGTGTPSNPTFTSSASTRSASIAYRISGVSRSLAPQLSTVATGTSTAPNATTCTPTGGAKDYLWITFFGMAGEQADDDTLVTGTPANYSNTLQKTCGVAGTNLGGMIGAAQRQLNAASEDAGAFTTVDNAAWRAYTLAVHPNPNATVTPASIAAVTAIDAPTVTGGGTGVPPIVPTMATRVPS